MMGRNRRYRAGSRRSNLKARLGIATAVVAGGGAIGAVALAAASHPGTTAARSAGYSRHYSYDGNQANDLAAGLSDYSRSHARAFAYFSHLANTNRETEMWRGHGKLAFERGTVVLATKRFVLIRAANGSFNVWWLSGGARVTSVAASMTGTTALTGSTWAAGAAMNGQMAPATAMLTGNTTAAQRVLAPTATTVAVHIAGTGITVSVTVTRNVATVAQNSTWWRQPAMATAAGLQRGDLVFIAGTRADRALHAKVILIDKAPLMMPATAPATRTVTPGTAPTGSIGTAGNHS
jgi:hypothetical protein